ncbi:hypothetical protein D9M68_17630 [compost metagenome]
MEPINEVTQQVAEPVQAGIEGPLVVIETTATIPMDLLKRKFKENVVFVIDVDNSRIKGNMLITYLTNLKLNCELKFGSIESALELLTAYLNMPAMAHLPEMEDLAMNIMLAAYGKDHFCQFDPTEYIRENAEIIDVWLRRLCALPAFALHCHPSTKELAKNYPLDEDHELHGINYVQLIKHELFPLFIQNFEEADMSYNEMLFNKYCFGGSNLFDYFANTNNPLFIGVMALDKPEVMQELMKAAVTTMENSNRILKEIGHVPSV